MPSREGGSAPEQVQWTCKLIFSDSAGGTALLRTGSDLTLHLGRNLTNSFHPFDWKNLCGVARAKANIFSQTDEGGCGWQLLFVAGGAGDRFVLLTIRIGPIYRRGT